MNAHCNTDSKKVCLYSIMCLMMQLHVDQTVTSLIFLHDGFSIATAGTDG